VVAATVYNTPDDGRKTASETCRVITSNKRKKERKKKLHLFGTFMTSIIKMHDTMNIKFKIYVVSMF